MSLVPSVSVYARRAAAITASLILTLPSSSESTTSSDAAREARALRKYIEVLTRNQALRKLRSDRRLDRVAADNSRALAEVGGNVPAGALSYLRFAMRRSGIYDTVVRAVALRYARGTRPRLPARIAALARQGQYSHLGIGVAGLSTGEWIATVVLVRRMVQIRDTRVARHTLRVCATLREGRRPQILLTTPSGRIFSRRPRVRRRRFCATLPRPDIGRYQLEVTVHARYGPEVAVLFPLFVGVPAPARPIQRVYPAGARTVGRAAARLLRLINETRRAARLRPLTRDARLARAARSHSQEMLARGFFGHVSPLRGGLGRRLTAVGLSDVYASENLAISSSSQRAHDSLLESPSHRKILLDPKVTALGVGVVREPGSGLFYITECFAQIRHSL